MDVKNRFERVLKVWYSSFTSMTSYKIHSIKDSKKLSFIIEGESEAGISQKLSEEGHIILSAEKIENPTENLFSFEGKKTDGSFLEWKISADDIFLAYEMLKNEYKYNITKLYPETVKDVKKQEKIFEELLETFQENTIKKPKKVIDTSKETLIKYKKTLIKLIELLQKQVPKGAENIIPDLKKLEQNSNVTLIQQELKAILKKLSTNKEDPVLYKEVRKLMKEMGMFVIPEIVIKILDKISQWWGALSPLIHPTEIHIQRHSSDDKISEEIIAKEYESIQDNDHIHTFLRKKYRPKITNMFIGNIKKYYLYTLLREKKSFLMGKKLISFFHKTATIALVFLIGITCFALFLGLYSTIFVTNNVIIFLGLLIISSLVIRSETV